MARNLINKEALAKYFEEFGLKVIEDIAFVDGGMMVFRLIEDEKIPFNLSFSTTLFCIESKEDLKTLLYLMGFIEER